MFTWGKIILALLTVVQWCMKQAERKGYVQLGEDKAISEALNEMLEISARVRKARADRERALDSDELSEHERERYYRDK